MQGPTVEQVENNPDYSPTRAIAIAICKFRMVSDSRRFGEAIWRRFSLSDSGTAASSGEE